MPAEKRLRASRAPTPVVVVATQQRSELVRVGRGESVQVGLGLVRTARVGSDWGGRLGRVGLGQVGSGLSAGQGKL